MISFENDVEKFHVPSTRLLLPLIFLMNNRTEVSWKKSNLLDIRASSTAILFFQVSHPTNTPLSYFLLSQLACEFVFLNADLQRMQTF